MFTSRTTSTTQARGWVQSQNSQTHLKVIKTSRARAIMHKIFSVRLLLLASFLVPVVCMAVVSYTTTTSSINRTTRELSTQTAENIIARVAETAQVAFAIAWNITKALSDELPDDVRYGIDYARIQPMLWRMWRHAEGNVVTMYYANYDGSNLAYYRNTDTSPDTLMFYSNWAENTAFMATVNDFKHGLVNRSDPSIYVDPPDLINLTYTTWWPEVVHAKEQFWTDIYYDSLPNSGVIWYTCVKPVLDPATNQTLGFMNVDITSSFLRDYLARIYVSENAQVWLMKPGSGILVSCSDRRERTYTSEVVGLNYAQDSNLEIIRETSILILNSTSKSSAYDFSYHIGGSKINAQVMEITDHNLQLILVVAYPENDFLGEVKHVQQQLVIISLATFAAALISGLFVLFMITTPLMKLGKKMNEISNGSFELVQSNSARTHLYEIRSLEMDFYRMVTALRSFGRFVPVDIVRYLLRNNTEAEAGVRQKELTCMFSDIVGFTTKVEGMSPDQLSILLSDYLNAMCAVIGDNEGTIDKFIGDAIMALWNVPSQVKNHEMLACEAALKSLAVLKELNVGWKNQGLPDVQCRIGIHTGKALVGNLGSKERLAFTAIGDNINLASRLESLNKKYGTSILVSGEVYEAVKHKYLCRYLDIVVVVGRTMSTRLYELVCHLENANAMQVQLCNAQAHAVDMFMNKDFEGAYSALKQLQQSIPHDICIQMLLERVQRAQATQNNLPHNWNGYLVLDEK